jgi:hypothetical protein
MNAAGSKHNKNQKEAHPTPITQGVNAAYYWR